MLSMILLVHFSLCNDRWLSQSVDSNILDLPPKPLDQSGYPYDDLHNWAQVSNPDLKLPDAQRNINNVKALEFPNEDLKIENGTENAWLVGRERNTVYKQRSTRNETDKLMQEFQNSYLTFGLDEADNQISSDNSYKYGMSVILRFLLEFYRIFRKLFSSQSTSNLPAIDVYSASYDEAVHVMKEKKNYSLLEISLPVRSADIFKSILYESVEIVQTKCNVNTPNWQCLILYIANLISESINCPNIWYDAFVQMLALETRFGVHDSYIYRLADIIKFTNMPFENIFDFVMEKIVEYREVGRIQLSTEAILFTMLADLQENGFLDGISLNSLYN